MAEATLVRKILLRASAMGMRLFRNQVGRYHLPDGRWIASGLCVGSSDLIGWTPVVVTPEMVGRTVAVFTAIETKVGDNDPTTEQANFIAVVVASGGFASVARSVADLETVTQGDQPHASNRRRPRARQCAAARQRVEYPLGHVASPNLDSARNHR